jgi:hypothetical protein
LHWECGHRWSTCRYLHQVTWWEVVLEAKEWIEHTWLLKYVLMHMPLLRAKQGKVDWHIIHTILRICLVHLVIPTISRIFPENQMNLMLVWYHYCFYAWYDLVVAYDIFVGLWS